MRHTLMFIILLFIILPKSNTNDLGISGTEEDTIEPDYDAVIDSRKISKSTSISKPTVTVVQQSSSTAVVEQPNTKRRAEEDGKKWPRTRDNMLIILKKYYHYLHKQPVEFDKYVDMTQLIGTAPQILPNIETMVITPDNTTVVADNVNQLMKYDEGLLNAQLVTAYRIGQIFHQYMKGKVGPMQPHLDAMIIDLKLNWGENKCREYINFYRLIKRYPALQYVNWGAVSNIRETVTKSSLIIKAATIKKVLDQMMADENHDPAYDVILAPPPHILNQSVGDQGMISSDSDA